MRNFVREKRDEGKNMQQLTLTMLELFALVLVGFIANRLHYTTPYSDRKLSGLIIDFTCPALVLSSVMGDRLPDRELVLPLLAVGFLTYIILTPIALFLPRAIKPKNSDKGIYGFMMIFGNVGFIGYPIVASIFGSNAIFYASVLNFPNTFFVFVLGSALISGGGKIRFNWKTLVSTPMLASYLSILIVFMGWDNIPEVISKPITLLGNITVPASLLIIGSQMAQMPLKKMVGTWRIYFSAGIKLFAAPLLLFSLFSLLDFNEEVVRINTIVIATPVAAYGTILCLKYNRDMSIITQATFLTNLLSVVTIPIVAGIIGV